MKWTSSLDKHEVSRHGAGAAGANSANYRAIPSHRNAHVPIIFNKRRQRPEVAPNKCCQGTTERAAPPHCHWPYACAVRLPNGLL